ncbi:MAG: hypothetical protein HGA19_18995 [Oscillochloris sp.]|nr:hypothetical protein [Oscillochloris sp.]
MKRLLIVIGSTALAALVGCSAASPSTGAGSTTTSTTAISETAQPNSAPEGGAPSGPGGPGGALQDDGTRAVGQIASVSGSTITINGSKDTTKDILTTGSTTFTLDGNSASLSDIAADQFIMAEGTTDTSGVFTATSVQASASQPQAGPGGPGGSPMQDDGTRSGGEVSGINGATITISGRDNASKDILTTSDTTFTLDNNSASLSDIAAGQFVMAEGTTDASGAFTATSVKASTSQPQGYPGPGGNGGTPPAQP